MSDATYGIDIVGHDRTAKGAKSAEKRLAAIPKRAGAAGQRYAQESERSLRRHTRSIVRTFSEVEHQRDLRTARRDLGSSARG
jgi:hypothetical protein